MGLFSNFFNYEKEGPGLEVEPPKKGIMKFLHLYFQSFWKITTVGIWYWLLCLPVVTRGLASAGITSVARNIAVGSHSFGTSDFWDAIKKNWKQSLVIGIINTMITALLSLDIYLCFSFSGQDIMLVGLGVCIVLFVFFSFVKFYIWNMVITFKLPLLTVYSNAVKLVFAGIKRNLLTALILCAYYALIVAFAFLPMPVLQFVVYLILFALLPGFRYYTICYNAFPVIRQYMIDPYYAEHPEADLELRRNLNMLD